MIVSYIIDDYDRLCYFLDALQRGRIPVKKDTVDAFGNLGLDTIHAPVVFTNENGSEVLWLKTPLARHKAATLAAGRRVVNAPTEDLATRIANSLYDRAFLLRKDEEPLLLFNVNRDRVFSVASLVDGKSAEEFEPLLQEFVVILANRITVHEYPDVEVTDGWHNIFDGRQIHFRGGYIDNDDNKPAIIKDDGRGNTILEYRKRNQLSRDGGPAYIDLEQEMEVWAKDGEVFEPTDEQVEAWQARNQAPKHSM